MLNLSKESYLKDKGSAYRYKQQYKLQETIVKNLGAILVDLDATENDFYKSINVIVVYLSNKQPQPLQVSGV